MIQAEQMNAAATPPSRLACKLFDHLLKVDKIFLVYS